MPKVRSKFFATLSLGIVFVFLTTAGFGCKGMTQAEKKLTQPITLEYWTIFDDVDALRANIEKYRVLRPYLTVNVRQLSVDEFYPRLVEALSEDRGPDIISIRNRWIRGYESKLAAMPTKVDDTLVTVEKTKLGTNTIVTPQTRALPTVGQLENEYVKAVKQDVVLGNQIYGLPLSLDNLAVYYNKDLLDRAGIAQPPRNWEEFQADVKKISKYDSRTGKITQSGAALGTGKNVAGADDLLQIIFRQSNVPFTGADGRALFSANPGRGQTAAINLVNFYTDFANPGRDTYSWNSQMGNSLDEFISGKVGFLIGYSYHNSLIKARAPQLNFGVLPMFQLNPDSPVNAANYWVSAVPAKSKNSNAAWGLIEYLTHSQATKNYLDATGRPSALRVYLSGQRENAALAPFVSQALVAENWYRGRNYEAAVKALSDMVDNWLIVPTGAGNVNEYRQNLLNQAAAKINQTL